METELSYLRNYYIIISRETKVKVAEADSKGNKMSKQELGKYKFLVY